MDYERSKIHQEFRTARGLVYQLLRNEPKCRDEDKWLCFRVYEEIAKREGKTVFIPFEIFNKFPSFETISRVRRKLQNKEGKFLPSNEVMAGRENKREFVREWSQKDGE